MAKMKQTKHDNIKEKAVIAQKNEKVINDFLLQFAYTLLIGVITIFAYNGIANLSYGIETYESMNSFMKYAAIVMFVIGIISLIWGIIKKKHGFKILSIYSFITTVVFMWYISDRIVDFINIQFLTDLYRSFGSLKIILSLFPLLGIAIVAEFVVYFIRYYKINRKK